MISVVVPVYNVKDYLEECINSILNQTFSDFELILVNDGSTDQSGKICEKYAAKDNRIKYIKKQNGGLSDARNAGIKEATGSYITFIDADDYIHNDFLKVLADNIAKAQADISICSFKTIRDDRRVSLKLDTTSTKILSKHEILHKMFENDCIGFIVAWAKLYNKELFSNINYPVGKIHEDEFVTYKLFAKANKIVYTEQKLYYYRIRSNSIMTSKLSEKSLVRLDAYIEQMVFFNKNNYNDLTALAAQRYIEKSADYYIYLEKYNPKIQSTIKNKSKELFSKYHKFFEYYTLRQRITVILFANYPFAYKQYLRIIKLGSKIKSIIKKWRLGNCQ